MRIMSVGDSLTYGIIDSSNRESGGYRINLDKKLEAAGINADFVGSLSNGPATDNQHEGYSGRTIDWLAVKAQQVLPIHKPDVVLFMAGTNDLKTDSVATMKSDMSTALDVLSKYAPNAQILVANLPPVQPNNTVNISPIKLAEFQAALPGIIATSIFTFILAWNDYIFTRILIASDELKTLPVGVQDLFHSALIDWGLIMAAGMMITIPALVFFVSVQRYLIRGWGAGAVKG